MLKIVSYSHIFFKTDFIYSDFVGTVIKKSFMMNYFCSCSVHLCLNKSQSLPDYFETLSMLMQMNSNQRWFMYVHVHTGMYNIIVAIYMIVLLKAN